MEGLWVFTADCPCSYAPSETVDAVFCRRERCMINKRVIHMRCRCERCGLESNVEGMEYANGARDNKDKKIPKHPRLCHVCREKDKVRKEEERAAALKQEMEDIDGLVIHHANTCFLCIDNEATHCLSTCTDNHMSANGPVPVMCKGCAEDSREEGLYRERHFVMPPLS